MKQNPIRIDSKTRILNVNSMKKFIVVAVYYPSYIRRVVEELYKIFSGVDVNFVFINNNKGEDFSVLMGGERTLYINGSNSSGEFSAWDEGVKQICSQFELDKDDAFLFLNDTFCHHRPFTLIDRWLYKKTLLNLESGKLYGEVNVAKGDFKINQIGINGWVTSYFFCCNWGVVHQLMSFSKSEEFEINELNKIKKCMANNTINIDIFSSDLNQHLSNWLFSNGTGGWYGKNKSLDALFFKLKAIINEKMLSYTALQAGIKVEDVYDTWWLSAYNRLRYKIYNLCRKINRRL